MKIVGIALISFLSFSVYAREVAIGSIANDYNTDKTTFSLELKDDNSIDGVRFVEVTEAGKIVFDDTEPSERVMTTGAVIYHDQGYDIVKLRVTPNFSLTTGGTVLLDYLYNGVTGSRSYMKINLVKKDDSFIITTLEGKPVTKFFVVSHRTPLGTVGIREIRTE